MILDRVYKKHRLYRDLRRLITQEFVKPILQQEFHADKFCFVLGELKLETVQLYAALNSVVNTETAWVEYQYRHVFAVGWKFILDMSLFDTMPLPDIYHDTIQIC